MRIYCSVLADTGKGKGEWEHKILVQCPKNNLNIGIKAKLHGWSTVDATVLVFKSDTCKQISGVYGSIHSRQARICYAEIKNIFGSVFKRG